MNDKPKRVGVRWNVHKRKWTASIGHRQYLGAFDSYDDAVAARLKAESMWPEKAKYGPKGKKNQDVDWSILSMRLA